MLKNVPETVQWIKKGLNFEEKNGLNLELKHKSPFYPGDLVTHMGEWEISTVTGRVPLSILPFYGTPLEHVRGIFLAIINVFLDELSQLPLSLIPAVYM